MNDLSFKKLNTLPSNSGIAELNRDDLKALIYGACFFASGGGGPISMALQFLTKIDKNIPLIQSQALKPDEKIVILADMGSPDAATEGRAAIQPPSMPIKPSLLISKRRITKTLLTSCPLRPVL